MKSFLQNIALLSSIVLLISCDGGGGGGSVLDVGVSLPEPSNGADGSALLGVISGARITVRDANGQDVELATETTTGADGSYTLVYSPDAFAAGIEAPLTIRIHGTPGATAKCDIDNADTDEDCQLPNGSFAAFGESFNLPSALLLRSSIPTIPADGPSFTANITPATEIASSIALMAGDGITLTESEVTLANAQVLSIIALVTGIDLTGLDLTTIPVVDLTTIGAAGATLAGTPVASFAVTSFAAAVLDLVDPAAPGREDIAAVLASVAADFSVGEDSSAQVRGSTLGEIASSVAKSLGNISDILDDAGVVGGVADSVAVAQGEAHDNADLFDLFGDEDVIIVDPITDDEGALAATKMFVTNLKAVLDRIRTTTGANGFVAQGATSEQSETEVFATELDLVNGMASPSATRAHNHLVEASLAAGEAFPADATDGAVTILTSWIDASQIVGEQVESTGWGISFLAIDEATGNFAIRVRVADLETDITAMHIHEAAADDMNGEFAVELGMDTSGAWVASGTLSAEVLTAYLEGGLYVNVHTSTFPGGEIRGQLVDNSANHKVTGTFTLGGEGTSLTFADVSSWSKMGDIATTVAVGSGTRTEMSLDLMDVTLTTTVMEANQIMTTMQTFTGWLKSTFEDEGEGRGLGLETLMAGGTLAGADAMPTFGLDIELMDISNADLGQGGRVTGSYSATISYTNADGPLAVNLKGVIGSHMQGFRISSGDTTIVGSIDRDDDADQDVDTLSDGVVVLKLVLDLSGVGTLVTGDFWVGGLLTGDLHESGTVTFTDNTIENLNL